MGFSQLFNKILGFIIIIVTLALAPSINTANALITGHTSVANCTGMSVVGAFGAPLIIIGLLVAGGAFALAGVKNQMRASARDLLGVVGSVIVVIVGLTFMVDIMTYTNTLYTAVTGFARTIYGIIPLVIYLGIIAGAGWTTVKAYRKSRKGRTFRTASY